MAKPKSFCSVTGCGKPAHGQGLCSTHYAYKQRRGDVFAPSQRKVRARCTVPDCQSPAYGHGYCSKHYQRWVRSGSPTAGRTDEGAAQHWLRHALAYSGTDCLPWPFAMNAGGYGVIRHEGRNHVVSRLICQIAHGTPPAAGLDSAHSCNNRICCNPAHVSWKTRLANMADALEIGTVLHGEGHPSAILTEDQVKQIRSLRGKMLQREIGEMFGVTKSAVGAIQRGDRWGWLATGLRPPAEH